MNDLLPTHWLAASAFADPSYPLPSLPQCPCLQPPSRSTPTGRGQGHDMGVVGGAAAAAVRACEWMGGCSTQGRRARRCRAHSVYPCRSGGRRFRFGQLVHYMGSLIQQRFL